MPKAPRKLSHDRIIFCYALLAGLPAVVVASCFLWFVEPVPTPKVQWTLSLLIGGCWLGFAAAVIGR